MINIQKIKVMTTGKTNIIKVDRQEIEVVESSIFLSSQITRNGLCENEIKRRLSLGRAGIQRLAPLYKNRRPVSKSKSESKRVGL